MRRTLLVSAVLLATVLAATGEAKDAAMTDDAPTADEPPKRWKVQIRRMRTEPRLRRRRRRKRTRTWSTSSVPGTTSTSPIKDPIAWFYEAGHLTGLHADEAANTRSAPHLRYLRRFCAGVESRQVPDWRVQRDHLSGVVEDGCRYL